MQTAMIRAEILKNSLDNNELLFSTRLPKFLAQICRARGCEGDAEILTELSMLPSYRSLLNIDQVVDRLIAVREKNETVCIIGDYDADGATSTALAIKVLRAFGYTNIHYVIPHRMKHGYGLTRAIIDVAKETYGHIDCLLTVDNGISSVEACAYAKELGMDVIITDHHIPGAVLPDALIINPNCRGCEFPGSDLAGCGVIFYVMCALRSQLLRTGWLSENVNMSQFLDFVTIGTIADCVPLTLLNRILCQQGLRRMRAGHACYGINALLHGSRIDAAHVHAIDVAFQLAPKLNAAGRLDDMSIGVKCLLAEDSITASRYVEQLCSLNTKRQDILSDMQEEVEQLSLSGDRALVTHSAHWHQGVIGILASKLKDKFNVPVAVFTTDEDPHVYKASCRSVAGIHMRDVLQDIANSHPKMFLGFGGHAMAAGCSIHAEMYNAFSTAFVGLVTELSTKIPLEKVILCDGVLPHTEIDLAMADCLYETCIFGQGFSEPIFAGKFRLVSKRLIKDGKHIKLTFLLDTGVHVDAMYFNCPDQVKDIASGESVTILYKFMTNSFKGQRSLTLNIVGTHFDVDCYAVDQSFANAVIDSSCHS